MQRYSLLENEDGEPEIMPDSSGAFVRYEDHDKEVREINEAVSVIKQKARREALEEAANTCRGLLPTTAQLDEMERHGMSFSSATRMCHDAIRELMDTRRDGE